MISQSTTANPTAACPSCKEPLTATITIQEGPFTVTYCIQCNYPVHVNTVQSYRAPSPHILLKQERT